MVEMEAPQPMNDDGMCSNSLKAVNIETRFLVDHVNASRVSAHLRERQLLTTTELESLPTAVSEKEKCRFVLDIVKPRINDASFGTFLDALTDAGYSQAVDKLRASEEKQTQLQATLLRYHEKWKSSLRYDQAFVDILEQEGVPPAIFDKVKDAPSDSQTAVFLDIVMEAAELPYDAFKNALKNTGQSHLVYLLKEKPCPGQEKEQIGRCVKMTEHIVESTTLKLWDMEKPSCRIALPGVWVPDWPAIKPAQKSLLTITTGSKAVDAILERYMRSTSDPLKIYEKLKRDRIVGKKLTMTTVAVFLGCCLKLTLTIGSNDRHVAMILRRMVRTFKRHIAYWFHHNGGWPKWTTVMDREIQARRDTEVAENFARKVKAHLTKLDKKTLEEIRSTGGDVKAYIVRVLRDIQIDKNITLVELGPGPIMEASDA